MGRAFEYRRAAKEKRWDKMSKIFPKLGKAITMAAKEGGIDPSTNAKLRTAIQNAKSENMPKDNIEAAISRSVQKETDLFSELNYEGKGPHGVLVFVECATDNSTRTVANVKSYCRGVGGRRGCFIYIWRLYFFWYDLERFRRSRNRVAEIWIKEIRNFTS